MSFGYKKLPAGTPRWVTISILLIGGALGVSISVYALIALYGLTGFLVNFFFPGSSFPIDASEALYLGIIGASSTLAVVLLSYLAVYMNGLSKKAIRLSGLVWAPALATTVLILLDTSFAGFMYPFSNIWVIGAVASLFLGGVLPWLLLHTKAGRKVHSK